MMDLKLTPAIKNQIQDRISVIVGGMIYHAWTAASVSRGIENLAGSFSVTLCENISETPIKIGINEGDECIIMVGVQRIMTGYVDAVRPSYDDQQTSLEITGRSKTADLGDCSATNKPGQWNNQKVEDIVKDICSPFGIAVICEVDTGDPIKDFQIQQGERCFDAIERLARLRGLLVYDDAYGNLVLSQAMKIAFPEAIIHKAGQNLCGIRSASANKSMGERYSDYIAKGQAAGDDEENGEKVASPKHECKDSSCKRYRPLLVVSEGQSKEKDCKKRAQMERSLRAGKSLEVEYTLHGWTTPKGTPWESNQRVVVMDDYLAVDAILLISEITWSVAVGSGSDVNLMLKPPYAFLPEESEPKLESGGG